MSLSLMRLTNVLLFSQRLFGLIVFTLGIGQTVGQNKQINSPLFTHNSQPNLPTGKCYNVIRSVANQEYCVEKAKYSLIYGI